MTRHSETSKGEGKRSPNPSRRRKSGQNGPPRRPPLFKRPIFRFVVMLLLILGFFELLLLTDLVKKKASPPYLEFHAWMSGTVLSWLGEDAHVSGSVVHSNRFSVNIKKGCDALQPCALFIAAVLASPVVFKPKIPGLVLGLLFLMLMNLVRVVSLFYVGIYFDQSVFDIMHHDVWQATFIFLAIVAWAIWALWAVKETVRARHASA
ncbi:MAG: exosortase H [Planctomycetes bacterium]|nr:exosortase H [Planctomycetota bacterium]